MPCERIGNKPFFIYNQVDAHLNNKSIDKKSEEQEGQKGKIGKVG